MKTWCESNEVDYLFGQAKNKRLEKLLQGEMAEAKKEFETTGRAARVFGDFQSQTLESWSRERRVVGKAEHLEKGANPRFVVTSLSCEEYPARTLYIEQDRIVVRFDKRTHNPILREAALDQPNQKIPWLQNLPVVFKYA